MLRAWVHSLVGELISHKPCSEANKTQKNKKTHNKTTQVFCVPIAQMTKPILREGKGMPESLSELATTSRPVFYPVSFLHAAWVRVFSKGAGNDQTLAGRVGSAFHPTSYPTPRILFWFCWQQIAIKRVSSTLNSTEAMLRKTRPAFYNENHTAEPSKECIIKSINDFFFN